MKLLRTVLVLALLWLPALVLAETAGKVALNFKDAEIEGVVKFISELTGKNFILDDRVRGKITVISPTELTLSEAYEVFQSILGVKGFTIVPAAENVFKIMPLAEAKQSNIETDDKTSDPGDRLVTRLVTLKNASPTGLVQILDQLRSRFGGVTAYEPSSLLIITDANSNIERLMNIIEALDVPSPGVEMEIFRLAYADAATVTNTLSAALAQSGTKRRTSRVSMPGQPAIPGQTDGQTQAKVIADARTNSIIVIADEGSMADAKSLIQALDIELPPGKGRINVVKLKYATAETISAVLGSLTQAGQKAKQAANVQAKPVTAPAAQPAITDKPAAVAVKADDMAFKFDEPVTIAADKATNSLVIVAEPGDFAVLKSVIDKLDVLRPQVLVEALVIQMSYKKMLELGVEWRTTSNPSSANPNLVGGTNYGNMAGLANLATNPFSTPTGMALAAVDGTIKMGGVTYPNIAALVTALQTKGDVEIISTPHALATDNEEAEMAVADNLPFKTSTVYDSNGNPRDNFEYKDVGLTLKFTPQINDDGFVKLKISQENSTVLSNTTANQLAPTTSKRSVKTTIVVKDGSTVVIGGLIQDDREVNKSTVPCLGDLPGIGKLFGTEKKTLGKTNLMVFLTPHVVREPGMLEKLTEERRQKSETFIKTRKAVDSIPETIKDITGFGEPEESTLKPKALPEAEGK